jgi:hypothetical protein
MGATLNGTIRTVTIAGNFTNNGTVTLTTGSLTVTAGTFLVQDLCILEQAFKVRGNLSYSGTFH